MALIDKLTNIADAIREKNGGTDPLTLDAMAEAIAGIEAGGGGSGEFEALLEGAITSINSNVTKIRRRCFVGLVTLKTLSLPLATELDASCCSGCTALTSVSIPNVEHLRGGTFDNCKGLTEVFLPSLTYLGNTDFDGCSNLKKADIGSGLNILAAATFRNCTVFDTLILRRTQVTFLGNVNAFANSPFASGGTGGTVYVPSALIESYKTATNWSTLYAAGACNFVAIEGSEYE